MISLTIKKLDNCSFLFIFQRTSCNCDDGSYWVPFNFAEYHWSINCNWIFILIIFHQNESSLLVCNTQANRTFLRIHYCILIPVNSSERNHRFEEVIWLYDSLQTSHTNLVKKLTVLVVHSHLSITVSDQQLFRAGGPAD